MIFMTQQVAILFQPWVFAQLAFHSAVSLSMDRHRSQQVSATQCQLIVAIAQFYKQYFFQLCETYEAKTARAGSSAICAGTLVSISPRDARTRYYSCVLPVSTEYISCSIACGHLSAKSILTFLHRWQMNLHEQSWPRTFHTTKEILFVKLSDDELVSQLRDG